MSISEFYVDNGLDPSDPDAMHHWLREQNPGFPSRTERRITTPPPPIPKPEKDELWMELCQDAKYSSPKSPFTTNELLFVAACNNYDEEAGDDSTTLSINRRTGRETNNKKKDNKKKESSIVLLVCAADAPVGIHPGALAPRFVLEATPTKLEHADNLGSYRRRLLCALHGRFVVMIAAAAAVADDDDDDRNTTTTTRSSGMKVVNHGVPEFAGRYCWRYWDNDGTVYEDSAQKWSKRVSWPKAADNDQQGLSQYNAYDTSLPGNFAKNGVIWLRKGGATDLSAFWECLWSWRFLGTTGVSLWDKSLHNLIQSANAGGCTAWQCPLDKNRVEAIMTTTNDESANAAVWNVIDCHQPTMVRFQRTCDGALVNIDWSTGFASSCWETEHGKIKQLFQRNIKEEELTSFRTVPKSHGRPPAEPSKKRKEVPSDEEEEDYTIRKQRGQVGEQKQRGRGEQLRKCALCGQEKPVGDFSKNQRKKGPGGMKCKTCVD